MVVALGTTLINKGIKNMCKYGTFERIEDAITNGADIFIGAGVTRFGETKPYIDLCAEVEALWGFVLGYNKQLNTIDAEGYYYRDYDHPFATAKWVLVGIPRQNSVYLILLETALTVAIGNKLKCVDGVFQKADTNDNYQMLAEEASTGAASTRKYIYARWVKS